MMRSQAKDTNITPAPAARRSGGLPIHVLLVDDHPAVRHGICQLLGTQGDVVTIAEAGNASEATSALARWAEVAVIDYHLGERDGLWLTQRIKRRDSPPPILIYSAFADTALAAAAIVAGADGLLAKTALAEELCVAIRRLFHGRQYFPAIPQSIIGVLRSRLAPTEQAIFSMLLDGISESEISSRLRIARADLDARRQAILQAVAPHAAGAGAGATTKPRAHAPLDYDRSARRRSYRSV
jgi:two-component system, NarL family, response regulator DevR